MARDTLKLEPVQLDTIAEGKLYDEFHEVQKHVLGTMPKPGDNPEVAFFDPSKPRKITIDIVYEPKDGGLAIGYEIKSKIPMRSRSRGGFAQFDPQTGDLVQFAARQQTIPGVVREVPDENRVTPIRKREEQ